MDAETQRNHHLAREALKRNRWDLAEPLLRKVLAREPRESWSLTALAATMRALHRFDEAVEQARLAVRFHPNYAYAHFTLATVLTLRDELEEGLSHGLEAIKLLPSRVRYYQCPACTHYELDQFKESAGIARDGLALEADNHGLQLCLAIALAGAGEIGGADDVLSLAMGTAPGNPSTLFAAGWVRLLASDLVAAELFFRQALAISPNLPEVHGGLGLVMLRSGRISDSIERLQESLCVNPYPRRFRLALDEARLAASQKVEHA